MFDNTHKPRTLLVTGEPRISGIHIVKEELPPNWRKFYVVMKRGPPRSSLLGLRRLAKSPASWASWRPARSRVQVRVAAATPPSLRPYVLMSLEMRKVTSQPDLFAFSVCL